VAKLKRLGVLSLCLAFVMEGWGVVGWDGAEMRFGDGRWGADGDGGVMKGGGM